MVGGRLQEQASWCRDRNTALDRDRGQGDEINEMAFHQLYSLWREGEGGGRRKGEGERKGEGGRGKEREGEEEGGERQVGSNTQANMPLLRNRQFVHAYCVMTMLLDRQWPQICTHTYFTVAKTQSMCAHILE